MSKHCTTLPALHSTVVLVILEWPHCHTGTAWPDIYKQQDQQKYVVRSQLRPRLWTHRSVLEVSDRSFHRQVEENPWIELRANINCEQGRRTSLSDRCLSWISQQCQSPERASNVVWKWGTLRGQACCDENVHRPAFKKGGRSCPPANLWDGMKTNKIDR